MPDNRKKNKLAGVDWFTGFMRRHPALAIRQPEATSLARAAAFNKVNIDRFFSILESTINKYGIRRKQYTI